MQGPVQKLAPAAPGQARRRGLIAGLAFAGFVFLADPRGPNLFPGVVAMVKAPFLSPAGRVLEAHRDAIRNMPGIREAVPNLQYDTVLAQTTGMVEEGMMRMGDSEARRFVAAQQAVIALADDAFVASGGAVPPEAFEPLMARTGEAALRRYLQAHEAAIGLVVDRHPRRPVLPEEAEAGWAAFYAHLSPADAARYRQVSERSPAPELAWAGRIYWATLMRMKARDAANVLRARG